MSVITTEVQAHWKMLRPLFSIRNEAEYDLAIERLNALLDEVGTDEEHPLYELLDTLGAVVHTYEEKYYPLPDCDGLEMLAFLMEEHLLEASDLPEIGSAELVEEILAGKQPLTVEHLQALSNKFNVSPAVFV
jgi:HTH-type transcriptional regulator/antitoxin HigA